MSSKDRSTLKLVLNVFTPLASNPSHGFATASPISLISSLSRSARFPALSTTRVVLYKHRQARSSLSLIIPYVSIRVSDSSPISTIFRQDGPNLCRGELREFELTTHQVRCWESIFNQPRPIYRKHRYIDFTQESPR